MARAACRFDGRLRPRFRLRSRFRLRLPRIDPPIAGRTNEWGTIGLTASALFAAYGRTKIIERVTLDAGNATPELAKDLSERSVDYFMAIKGAQGQVREHAVDVLADRAGNQADHRVVVDERGKMICYSVWCTELDDDFGFEGTWQVVRIERVVAGDDETTVGNRPTGQTWWSLKETTAGQAIRSTLSVIVIVIVVVIVAGCSAVPLFCSADKRING